MLDDSLKPIIKVINYKDFSINTENTRKIIDHLNSLFRSINFELGKDEKNDVKISVLRHEWHFYKLELLRIISDYEKLNRLGEKRET